MIPQVRVIAVSQTEIERDVVRDVPRVRAIELEAIVEGHARWRVEGQQVLADSEADVAHRRVEKVGLRRKDRERPAEAGAIDADAGRLGEGKLAINRRALPIDAEASRMLAFAPAQ